MTATAPPAGDLRPFANEPILELRRASVRAGLAGALEAVDARGPVRVPVWVGDDARYGDALVSTDPGQPTGSSRWPPPPPRRTSTRR